MSGVDGVLAGAEFRRSIGECPENSPYWSATALAPAGESGSPSASFG
jgi:hypothetical protein